MFSIIGDEIIFEGRTVATLMPLNASLYERVVDKLTNEYESISQQDYDFAYEDGYEAGYKEACLKQNIVD